MLYWLADLNNYTRIDGVEYVTARRGLEYRCAYAVGVGLACATLSAVVVRGVGRNWFHRYVAIVVTFTAILCAVADLNMYVVSFGPEGQDWVKNGSSGVERLFECAVLASVLGTIAFLILCGTEPLRVPATPDADHRG